MNAWLYYKWERFRLLKLVQTLCKNRLQRVCKFAIRGEVLKASSLEVRSEVKVLCHSGTTRNI